MNYLCLCHRHSCRSEIQRDTAQTGAAPQLKSGLVDSNSVALPRNCFSESSLYQATAKRNLNWTPDRLRSLSILMQCTQLPMLQRLHISISFHLPNISCTGIKRPSSCFSGSWVYVINDGPSKASPKLALRKVKEMTLWTLHHWEAHYHAIIVHAKPSVTSSKICKYALGKMEIYVNDIGVTLAY